MYETYRMLGHEHEADLEREARKRTLARGSAKNGSRWPMLILAAVALVVVALGVTSAAASASNAPVVIPFEKHWVAPGHYVGTACDGASLDVQMSNSYETGNAQHFTATFVLAGLPSGRGFTAVLQGIFNNSTGRTVLNGTVTDGWLAGAQIHEEGQFVGVTATGGPIFNGTLQITGSY
jgi:hypothetical protein